MILTTSSAILALVFPLFSQDTDVIKYESSILKMQGVSCAYADFAFALAAICHWQGMSSFTIAFYIELAYISKHCEVHHKYSPTQLWPPG